MAIARLLLPKPALHFSTRASFLPARRCSSSPSDGRNDVLKSEAPENKDAAQKGKPWNLLGGILTNIKQKIVENTYLKEKTSALDSSSTISAKSVEVSAKDHSSGDTTGMISEGLSMLKKSKRIKPDSLTKKESSESETAFQSITKLFSGFETSHETEITISLKENQLDNNLDSSESVKMKVVDLVSAENLDLLEERRSGNGSLTNNHLNGTSEGTTSLRESQEQSQPKKGQTYEEKKTWMKIIKAMQNQETDYKSRPLVMLEASDNSSETFTGEFRTDACLCGDDKLEFSDRLQMEKKLDKLLKGGKHDQMTEDVASSAMKSTNLSKNSGDQTIPLPGKGEDEQMGIKSILDCIKHLPFDNAMGKEKINPLSDTDLSNSNAGKCKSVSKVSTSSHGRNNEETGGASLVKQNQAVSNEATLAGKTVLVRFLPHKFTMKDIYAAFNQYGDILDVQVATAVKGCIFKDAFVTFRTNAAARKAMKNDLLIDNHDVVVEGISMEDAIDRVSIPDLIGDPDAPVALVKEPTRTVKIQPLPLNISSDQIKEAFGFCGGKICRFFLGSSSSIAFVEFETEDAKERALAEHSISVAGTQLFISRIDVPRTTVLRISHLPETAHVKEICKRYGRVKKVICRMPGLFDVYFKRAEWPNMLNILNSLNGKVVKGKKMVVSPSPVIPSDVLIILMGEAQGKGYIKEVINGLVRKLETPMEVSHLSNLITEIL